MSDQDRTAAVAGDEVDPAAVRFDAAGLVPAVVQQHDTGEVLMVAWMDAQALRRTLDGGETVFWSRSRREPWHKGATSGDTQRVVEVRVDCDADTLLVLVDQRGRGACHTGERSCFGRTVPLRDAAGPAPMPPAPPTWRRAADPPTDLRTDPPTDPPTDPAEEPAP